MIKINDDNFDARNTNEPWKDDEVALKQYSLLLEDATVQEMFNEYNFDSTLTQNTNDKPTLASIPQRADKENSIPS